MALLLAVVVVRRLKTIQFTVTCVMIIFAQKTVIFKSMKNLGRNIDGYRYTQNNANLVCLMDYHQKLWLSTNLESESEPSCITKPNHVTV